MRSINKTIKGVDVTAGLVNPSEMHFYDLKDMLDKSSLHQTLSFEIGENYLGSIYQNAIDNSLFADEVLFFFITKLRKIAEPFFEEVDIQMSEENIKGVFLLTFITV